MGQLAILGNPLRGKEIIEFLKNCGGKDQPIPCNGTLSRCAYFIKDGYIVDSFVWASDKIYVTMEMLDMIYNALKPIKEMEDRMKMPTL